MVRHKPRCIAAVLLAIACAWCNLVLAELPLSSLQLSAGRLDDGGSGNSGGRRLSGRAALQTGQVSADAGDGAAKCPPVSKEVLQRQAKDNTVMLAVVGAAAYQQHRCL
jgi:hypothetical protein